jgi:hypothetical protein
MPLKKSVSYEGLMGDAFGKYGEKKKKKNILQLSVIINIPVWLNCCLFEDISK